MTVSRGSQWGKWDLHVHTPLSFESQYGMSSEEREDITVIPELKSLDTPDRLEPQLWTKYVQELEDVEGINALAITDYFSIEGFRIIQSLREDGYLDNFDVILPNIEFRIDTVTGEQNRINVHVIFSEELSIDDIEQEFLVQAEGAAPFVEAFEAGADDVERWDAVETRATAIRIGNPVNAPKALPGVRETGGTAVAVADEAITDAQRALAEEGIGVEPASAASVAGLRKLRDAGVVDADEHVVCLTTGHLLKDPDAAAAAGTEPEPVPAEVDGVLEVLGAEPA